ncbi:recombinase family protein [Novacetimonas hansenii]|uniref:recombinase family protein n=1 Tax=Novacetimonas hansenii TaxID=436 RepID=UPI00177AED14|nr:recombinase family protein [Novacetimonas hansenii]QOF94228.1 recombinase family protein [Novacetimonas hansenii]
MHGKFVAYYRVSTEKQGKSGLGIEAQQHSVRQFLNGGDWELLAEFTEIETGKNDDRPQLERAMNECRLTGATLVIAKIDRLSRNAAFLIGLKDAGISFVAADMPGANQMTIGIMALVAQQEREAISQRTKEALAAAKARGVKLGGYRGGPMVNGKAGTEALQQKTAAFRASVRPLVTELHDQGMSQRQIAAELDRRSVRTPRGGKWTAKAVAAVLAAA